MDLEELIKQNDVKDFSQSRQRFMDETNHQDLLVIVLRAHIYIEQELYLLINKCMKYPEKLNVRYLSDKLKLAYSLGLIEQGLFSSIMKLNDFRNKYAHQLDFNFTEKELNEIVSPLSKEEKTELEKDYAFYGLGTSDDFITKVRITLSFIYLSIKLNNLTLHLRMEELLIEHKSIETDRRITIIKSQQI
ncbi:hypothetical protein HMPREF1210_01122 [Paenisporosarcina sp. HGH0030]|uniref:hypothetical protein n=1 Tax=Paenisporosarcina sp. HGH0030 TaxID=1078085 RepID=UPI00034E2F39|nr:hypothetical protein [Paenisporosarcina sp. HGH0030]EPD52742.1 hypothetical protein HMPREF1210_01122 [Paenisporosarcina sp. HGH0030]